MTAQREKRIKHPKGERIVAASVTDFRGHPHEIEIDTDRGRTVSIPLSRLVAPVLYGASVLADSSHAGTRANAEADAVRLVADVFRAAGLADDDFAAGTLEDAARGAVVVWLA